MNVSGVRRKIQRWDDVNGMVMEDDYDSIDGIINNGAKKDPEEEIRAEHKSVKEKIRENEEKLKSQIHEPPHIRKDPLCPDRNLC